MYFAFWNQVQPLKLLSTTFYLHRHPHRSIHWTNQYIFIFRNIVMFYYNIVWLGYWYFCFSQVNPMLVWCEHFKRVRPTIIGTDSIHALKVRSSFQTAQYQRHLLIVPLRMFYFKFYLISILLAFNLPKN